MSLFSCLYIADFDKQWYKSKWKHEDYLLLNVTGELVIIFVQDYNVYLFNVVLYVVCRHIIHPGNYYKVNSAFVIEDIVIV